MTSAVCRQVPSITYAMLSRPAMQLLAAPYFSSSRAKRKVDLQAGSCQSNNRGEASPTDSTASQRNPLQHSQHVPQLLAAAAGAQTGPAAAAALAARAQQLLMHLDSCTPSPLPAFKGVLPRLLLSSADSCQPAHLALVAENAMYSSSLLAPAVASVSMELPPPTNRATQVLGPDTSRAAALTSPTEPVCIAKGQDTCVGVCDGQTLTAAVSLQICWAMALPTARPSRVSRVSSPVGAPSCTCCCGQRLITLLNTYLELRGLRAGHIGHEHARQGLRQGGCDALAAEHAPRLWCGHCWHCILRESLATGKAVQLHQQRAQLLR